MISIFFISWIRILSAVLSVVEIDRKFFWLQSTRHTLLGVAVQAYKYFRQIYPEQRGNNDSETGECDRAVNFWLVSAVHKSEMEIDDVNDLRKARDLLEVHKVL